MTTLGRTPKLSRRQHSDKCLNFSVWNYAQARWLVHMKGTVTLMTPHLVWHFGRVILVQRRFPWPALDSRSMGEGHPSDAASVLPQRFPQSPTTVSRQTASPAGCSGPELADLFVCISQQNKLYFVATSQLFSRRTKEIKNWI